MTLFVETADVRESGTHKDTENILFDNPSLDRIKTSLCRSGAPKIDKF